MIFCPLFLDSPVDYGEDVDNVLTVMLASLNQWTNSSLPTIERVIAVITTKPPTEES